MTSILDNKRLTNTAKVMYFALVREAETQSTKNYVQIKVKDLLDKMGNPEKEDNHHRSFYEFARTHRNHLIKAGLLEYARISGQASIYRVKGVHY